MRRTGKWFAGISILAVTISAAAIYAAAQAKPDLSGPWTLTVGRDPMMPPPAAPAGGAAQGQGQGRGGRGGGPPVITFTQNGDTLTGTMSGGRGGGTPVTGTISGNTVTWTIQRRLADGIERPEVYKGTVDGDTITGSVAEPTVDPTQAYSVDFTAKRGAPPAPPAQ
jgi:hypothetical protein